MFPVGVDPDWYEKYWFSDRPRPLRMPLTRGLARFGVLVALLAGSGVVLSHYPAGQHLTTYQDWEQE